MGKEAARREVEDIARQLKDRLQVSYHWHGDQLHFERSGADGRIDVTEDTVDVDIELGLMLSPMKGMIQKQVEEYLDSRLR